MELVYNTNVNCEFLIAEVDICEEEGTCELKVDSDGNEGDPEITSLRKEEKNENMNESIKQK